MSQSIFLLESRGDSKINIILYGSSFAEKWISIFIGVVTVSSQDTGKILYTLNITSFVNEKIV